MKAPIALLLLLTTPLFAEQVTVSEPLVLRGNRSLVSIKPGDTVDLIASDGVMATIKYRGVTGAVQASRLKSEVAKSSATPGEASASATPKVETRPAPPPPPPAPEKAMQSSYGKAVQKARHNASAHEKGLVKPTDGVTKDQ